MQKRLFAFLFGLGLLTSPIFAQTYTAPGGVIPDDGGFYMFDLPVADLQPALMDTAYGLVEVCLSITHTYVSDLEISLIAPDGTETFLFRGVGGDGDDFLGTCFRQDAPQKISIGQAPFSGMYNPQGQLGKFNQGRAGNGLWRLKAHDTYAFADGGDLLEWSLTFGPHAPGLPTFPGSDIPLFIVNTPLGQAIDGEKKPAQFKIIHNNSGKLNHPSDPAEYVGKVGIRIRGAFSSSLPQKPYLMETWTASGADTSVSLLGLPAENDWILQATYNDKVFLRNTQMFEIARAAGQYAPRSRYGELFLNGEYQGIYFLCEKIKVDNDRVDLKKMEETDHTWPDISGGYVFKHDYPDGGWASAWNPPNCPDRLLEFQYVYPKPERITLEQAAYIKSYVDSFETALLSPTFDDPATGYRKYMDEASFIDYLLINEAARNGDGYKKSLYFHKDRKGLIYAGPIWDFDWALKFVPWADDDLGGLQYLSEPCNEDVPIIYWFRRMMEDTVFANRAACRWAALRATVLDTNRMFQVIDSTAAYLYQAQQRHYDYWGTLGINVGTPENGPIPTTFEGEIERYKEFFRRRLRWLDDQLPGKCSPSVAIRPEAQTPAVRVYPTLTQGLVFVEIPPDYAGNGAFSLSDVQGNRLQDGIIPHRSGVFSIDMSAYPVGTYLLRITLENAAPVVVKLVRMNP